MEIVTVCPITSVEVDASFVRVPIAQGQRSGLDRPSWIMADKIVTVPRSALRLPALGRLDARAVSELEDALRNWLDLQLAGMLCVATTRSSARTSCTGRTTRCR